MDDLNQHFARKGGLAITPNSPVARWIDFIADVPSLGERGARRLWIIGRGGMPIGALVHVIWAVAFWFVDQPMLAMVNIAISALWLWGCFVLFDAKRMTADRLKLVMILCIYVETPAHAVLATTVLGTGPLFYLYLVTPLTALSLAYFLTFRTRIAIFALLTGLFVFTSLLSLFAPPLSPMSEAASFWFGLNNALALPVISTSIMFMHMTANDLAEARVQREKDRADGLLLNILPEEIAERLKDSSEVIAQEHEDATILFADIVGFTESASVLGPKQIVDRLNLVFSAFDALATKHGVEKIKTIGDAYMVVAGLPAPRPDHAAVMVEMAKDMLAAVEEINETLEGEPIRIRIGVNSGPVVAGVIGRSKFAYDLWGDAVNVAARMEQTGVAGEARLTEATRMRLGDGASCEPRGEVEVKGKGRMPVFALNAD